jgi:hypothetical protein
VKIELKKNSCEEKLQIITRVSYSFPKKPGWRNERGRRAYVHVSPNQTCRSIKAFSRRPALPFYTRD